MTLGFMNGELERPLIFEHDILSEEQIKKEREESLKIILARKNVKISDIFINKFTLFLLVL